MIQLWETLESWLRGNAPNLLSDLNPPATRAQIDALEQSVGVHLPADFVECLRVHNGQAGVEGGLFDGTMFLSTERMLSEWRVWKGLLDSGDFEGTEVLAEVGVQPVWWCSEWIPFTYNGMGDHLCLDLAPATHGRYGQIITLWHDDGTRKKKADSFAKWFAEFVGKTIKSE